LGSLTFTLVWGIFICGGINVPQIIAKDAPELKHHFLSLVMLVMNGCLVQGVGFIPNNIWARYLFSPYIWWPIMGYEAYSWWV
jgi:predicted membrane protein